MKHNYFVVMLDFESDEGVYGEAYGSMTYFLCPCGLVKFKGVKI